jgi:hypothetical protein
MNGNGSVSFGNDKMEDGRCDVLRSVWNGIFLGVKAVRRVYALDGSCVCMCPFPFSFFWCLDDVRFCGAWRMDLYVVLCGYS